MNFVKKIVKGQADEAAHYQFTRFGQGEYDGRFIISLWKTKKVKIRSSFEFANDLVLTCASLGKCKGSGIVLSKKDITEILKKNNIEGNSETKKGGLYYKNTIEEQELTPEQLIELNKVSYFTLMDLEGADFKLKTKQKLPKPGKKAEKVDSGFCQLETDEKNYQKIKDDFFWDLPDGRKIKTIHKVMVNEIVMPKGEKDFSKIRELAKRKGKILRKSSVDAKEINSEFDFEV